MGFQDVTPLTFQDKSQIRSLLLAHVEKSETAVTIPGVSPAILAEILKGDRMNISHKFWLMVGKAVGWKHRHKIKIVDTKNSKTLLFYFDAAKENGETFALVGNAGSGKTFVGMHYAKANAGKNVYLLQCAEYLNKDTFLKQLLKVMGRNAGGRNVYEMMEEIVTVLSAQDRPLIIMDEIDKLKPAVLSFFITLYNNLHGLCGIVWMSTDAIVHKIDRGVKLNKVGFNEIFSRIGRRFIELPGITKKEVELMCKENGITEPEDIAEVCNECEGDCRRVDRMIIKNQMKKKVA